MAEKDRLRTLVRDLETDLVERKESATDRGKIAQAICAYSNDLPNHRTSGFVLIGVTDTGACSNIDISDSLMLMLSSIRDNGNILPLPIMSVAKVALDGCTFVAIEVQPHPVPPVRFDGRTWIRVGPRRATATIDEERILAEKQRAGARSYDQRSVPGAVLSDINQRLFLEEYLPSAVSRDVLNHADLDVGSQLRGVRMLSDDGTPNLAAVLTLTDDPRRFVAGAYIQFVRYAGSDVFAPIADEKEIDGPLASMLTAADDLMRLTNSIAVDFTSGTLGVATPEYPLVALQQIVRNAVMHRNYETSNAPVKIFWFSDRIEIHNPGGLYGQVNAENFGRPGVSDYRNPIVAEIMKTLGFVQRFGIGIPTAQKAVLANGNPEVRFDFTSATFAAIVGSR